MRLNDRSKPRYRETEVTADGVILNRELPEVLDSRSRDKIAGDIVACARASMENMRVRLISDQPVDVVSGQLADIMAVVDQRMPESIKRTVDTRPLPPEARFNYTLPFIEELVTKPSQGRAHEEPGPWGDAARETVNMLAMSGKAPPPAGGLRFRINTGTTHEDDFEVRALGSALIDAANAGAPLRIESPYRPEVLDAQIGSGLAYWSQNPTAGDCKKAVRNIASIRSGSLAPDESGAADIAAIAAGGGDNKFDRERAKWTKEARKHREKLQGDHSGAMVGLAALGSTRGEARG